MALKAVRGHQQLLNRVHGLMRTGALKQPKWYAPMMKAPPLSLPIDIKPTKELIFPEDELIKDYYERFPTEQTDVLNLEKPLTDIPAIVFVRKQMELMNKENLSKEAAFDKAGTFLEQSKKAETQDVELDTVSLKNLFEQWTQAEQDFWNSTKVVLEEEKTDEDFVKTFTSDREENNE